jgi:hypothetical protein
MINIINFDLPENSSEKFHTTYHLKELERNFVLTETIELHFVELKKLMHFWEQDLINVIDITSGY